jgi:hypothetical protein
MGKSYAELLASMDSPELTEWEALYTLIEPMPEDRADLRMGITVSNAYAPHIRKGAAMPRPSDFIPKWDGKPSKPKQTIDQMKAIWDQAARAFSRKKKK